jgi:putative MATE family efflux protein
MTAAHGPDQVSLNARILRLALPALGALLLEPLYNLTDTAIVGHLGRPQLGGLALAAGVLNVVWWTTAFLGQVTLTRVAQGAGSGERSGAGRAVGAAYVLALLLGIVGALAVEALAHFATALLGGHGAVAANSETYLHIAALGIAPLLLSVAGTGHLNGLGRPRRTLEITLAASLLNVALEVFLVYGAHLGIAGSAWGTVAAQIVAAGGFWASSQRSSVRPARPRRDDLRRLVADGIPLTVRTLALDAVLLAATAIAARLGPSDLAAQQVVLQVWILLALSMDCLAVAGQILVGEATGRDDLVAVRAVGRRVLLWSLGAGAALGGLTLGLAGPLPSVFTSSPRVAAVASGALLVCGAQQPVAALAFVLDGLLLGVARFGALRRAMLAALLAFVPAGAAVLAFPAVGIVGLWLALTVWVGVRALILYRGWVGYLGRSRGADAPAPPVALSGS